MRTAFPPFSRAVYGYKRLSSMFTCSALGQKPAAKSAESYGPAEPQAHAVPQSSAPAEAEAAVGCAFAVLAVFGRAAPAPEPHILSETLKASREQCYNLPTYPGLSPSGPFCRPG